MGQQLVFMPECHSTNDLIQQLIKQKGLTEGMVVITANQTAGRGQRGNIWFTEPGKNLTFSLALKPVFLPARDHFMLNVITSLAIRDCLVRWMPETNISIKWPNDVMIGNKKVCGILIENQVSGLTISETVIGIGLNVNQEVFGLLTATSMMLASGKSHALPVVFESLMESLESLYLQLRAGGHQSLRNRYTEVLFRRNESHRFMAGNKTFTGTITGISEDGLLQVDDGNAVRTFQFKEIAYVID
jgi:BirA family biotin operon repressor/biotin-[acetyl-CoA-carboxylase] ligase